MLKILRTDGGYGNKTNFSASLHSSSQPAVVYLVLHDKNVVTLLLVLIENIFHGREAEDWDGIFNQSGCTDMVNSILYGGNGNEVLICMMFRKPHMPNEYKDKTLDSA